MGSPVTRDLVLAALERVIERQEPADRVLDRSLRSCRELSSQQRAAVARRVLGIACLRGRLDYLLRRVIDRPIAEWNRWRLGAYMLLEEGLEAADAAAEAGIEDVAALSSLARPVSWPRDPVERLAAARSLPRWLAQLWHDELGAEADALAATMNRPGPIGARANRLRASRDELVAALARESVACRPMRFSPDGVELAGRPNIFGLDAWRRGLFEVQDEGSQLIAHLASPQPDMHVVDFCAGAGGKTLALASLMGNRGRLVALDVNASKLADMRPRLKRAGVTIVQAEVLTASGPLPRSARGADLVLVDAPCSSLGTLRRGPDVRWRLCADEVAAYPARQRAILERAATAVRPGGRLVYATCTIHRAENEAVAEAFASSHRDFEPVPAAELLGVPLAQALGARWTLKLLPHAHGCDGFFACCWQRA